MKRKNTIPIKKLLSSGFLVTLLLGSMTFMSCDDDNPHIEKYGLVKFGYQSQIDINGRILNSDDQSASAILISLENDLGESILTSEEVDLYDFNGNKISEPLSLSIGTYSITEYHIVDDASNVLFSVPLVGSELAYLVDNPLPLSFTVTKDQTESITPEVLSILDFNPEDFGYASFALNIVNTLKILVSALVFNLNPLVLDYELTTATITITNGTTELYNGNLSAITNEIVLRDDQELTL